MKKSSEKTQLLNQIEKVNPLWTNMVFSNYFELSVGISPN